MIKCKFTEKCRKEDSKYYLMCKKCECEICKYQKECNGNICPLENPTF